MELSGRFVGNSIYARYMNYCARVLSVFMEMWKQIVQVIVPTNGVMVQCLLVVAENSRLACVQKVDLNSEC